MEFKKKKKKKIPGLHTILKTWIPVLLQNIIKWPPVYYWVTTSIFILFDIIVCSCLAMVKSSGATNVVRTCYKQKFGFTLSKPTIEGITTTPVLEKVYLKSQILVHKYWTILDHFCVAVIVSFWITLAHSKECTYHIFGQYWYTRNVPVFNNYTGTFQYLGPKIHSKIHHIAGS